MDHLNGLNQQQKEAAVHTEGPLLIVAGAGAGKTKTLTHRMLHLIKQGVPPNAILAITFTNKAAKEMQERVRALLAPEGETPGNELDRMDRPFVSTFHALGVYILRAHGKALGLPRFFSILDKSDAQALIKEAVVSLGLDPKQFEPAKFARAISKQKGNLVTIDGYKKGPEKSFFGQTLSKIWEKYEDLLSSQNALDFDDLLLKPALLFKQHPEIRDYYRKKWQYIHIDEYQDTNAVQYELAQTLAHDHKNICVVGDVDQTIYTWRGADIKNILTFEKDYPDAKVVLLEENYRSTQNILAAANSVIKKNKQRTEKNLYTKNKEGDLISVYEAYDETDEAKYVARTIKDLIKSKVEPRDIAILYRANFQSRALEEALLHADVPYQVLGVRFFERKEVKDVIAYLKAGVNPESIADIKRIINVPTRGIGKTTVLRIFAGERDKLTSAMRERVDVFYKLLSSIGEKATSAPLTETIKFIMRETGIEKLLRDGTEEDAERLENLRELVTFATKYAGYAPEESLEKFLSDVSLATDQDSLEKDANAVKLMTVHAAKGLEFPYVFITGLEQGLFPHQGFGGEGESDRAEEERRLFYVALTRAEEKVHLSHAAIRTIFGSKQFSVPSEFFADIEDDIIEQKGGSASTDELLPSIFFD